MYMLWKNEKEALSDAANSSASAVPTICVRDVMTREVKTLAPHDNFGDAITLIANNSFHHLVVTEADGRVVGVVSDRDILRSFARASDWKAVEVSQIMTPRPTTVIPEAPLVEALSLLISMRINCLPVVGEDGKLCGILTSTDLMKSFHGLLTSRDK